MIAKRFILCFLALLTAVPVVASVPNEVAGVQFDRAMTITDTQLHLQGIGVLHYMVFIKAYAGALYLPRSASPDNVLGPVPKRLEISYFHAIKAKDFAKATRVKIKDNLTNEAALSMRPRIDQFAALYQDVSPGDRYALTYAPGQGTVLSLNGRALGTIPGDDFASAVFAIWLGDNPIDKAFRDKLLGAS